MRGTRTIRDWLKWACSPVVVTIKGGPLKGHRWIAISGVKFSRGDYEPEKTAAILRVVRPGDVVYDIGAHVGYFSVILSRGVGPEGRVFSFEPRPLNGTFLRRHVTMNGVTNVTVFGLGVGRRGGRARLETRTGTGTGHVSAGGNVGIDVISIDEAVASGMLPPPTLIKMDIEGGEREALEGAARTIEAHRPRIVLATHGDALWASCGGFLTGLGYTLEDVPQRKGDRETIAWPGEAAARGRG